MTTIIDGTSGVTFPAGGVGNPAGAVVGTTDTQTLTNKSIVATQLTGTIASARLPTGSVLQVVTDKNTNSFSTTSQNVYVTTSQTLSITPSSASNKILVMFSAGSVTTTVANTGGGVQVRRSGTVILESGFYQAAVSGNITPPFGSQIALDSPSTTSSITYEVFAQETGIPGTFTLNANRVLTLMEIAG